MDWLHAHRVLLVVFGAALFLGWFELTDSELAERDTNQPRLYLDAEVNLADVSAELYPDRALTLYYQAFQASLCQGAGPDAQNACARRGPPKPGEIRELFERSIATGNRSNELALYNYALVLLQERATEAEVDAAIHGWRATYPRSQRPDPREVYAQLMHTAQRSRSGSR